MGVLPNTVKIPVNGYRKRYERVSGKERNRYGVPRFAVVRPHDLQTARTDKVFHGAIFLVAELDRVRDTHRAGPHPVGFGITDKLSLAQIELQASPQLLADVGRKADVHGLIHNPRIRHRRSARANAVKEIPHMVQGSLRARRIIRQHFLVFAHQRRR